LSVQPTPLLRTCFWAGDTFAPKLRVKDGDKEIPIQQYLQDAFLDMYGVLVQAIGDLEGVLGFEVICLGLIIVSCY
jgi:hypothetical protein